MGNMMSNLPEPDKLAGTSRPASSTGMQHVPFDSLCPTGIEESNESMGAVPEAEQFARFLPRYPFDDQAGFLSDATGNMAADFKPMVGNPCDFGYVFC